MNEDEMFTKAELRFIRKIMLGRLMDARSILDSYKGTMRHLEAEAITFTLTERLCNKLDEQLYGGEE